MLGQLPQFPASAWLAAAAQIKAQPQATYSFMGEPAGYNPYADPNNPCYNPNPTSYAGDIVGPAPSPACADWMQAHLIVGPPGSSLTAGSSTTSFLQQNGLLIAGAAIAAVLLFALLK